MKLALTLATLAAVSHAKNHRLLHGLGPDAPQNKVLLEFPKEVIRDTNNVRMEDVQELNFEIEPYLSTLIGNAYFRTYKVDLTDARCPWKDEEAMCGNYACAIQPLSEEDVRLQTPQYLGRLRKNSVSKNAPKDSLSLCAPEDGSIYRAAQIDNDRDYCYPEDESSGSSGVWVDLTDNVERYTGYTGDHAHKMWDRIYGENCFGYVGSDYNKTDLSGDSSHGEKSTLGPIGSAEIQLAQVFAHPHDITSFETELIHDQLDSQCVEQRLFYKLLSGMHASISTHLTYDWLNTTSGDWGPNLIEFLERVGWHEDRLNHLFFNYALVSRAVAKLQTYEQFLSFSPICSEVDSSVRFAIDFLAGIIEKFPPAINESELFASPQGAALKDEFRKRVRNVNALMSCVGCERCRLWGKIQTAGYGTALKILFELPERPELDMQAVADVLSDFRRSELVALIQTFGRLSHSVTAVSAFRNAAEYVLIDKDSVAYQVKYHIAWTWQALSFIFQSYLDFPKNMGRLLLLAMHSWWTKFITGNEATPIPRSQHIDF